MEPVLIDDSVTDSDRFVQISIKADRKKEQHFTIDKKNLNKFINDSKDTILHLAVKYKNIEVVKKLIEMGCNVNAQNRFGASPLLLATTASLKNISPDLIEILCKANANIHLHDNSGNSPLKVVADATKFTMSSIVQIILQKLQNECKNNNKLMAERLIEINCPLACAICLKNVQVTKFLIDSGTAVDAPHSHLRHTALHIAVSLMDLPNIKLLVDRGANAVARDVGGVIPLGYYKGWMNETEQAEIVRILTSKPEFLMAETIDGKMQIGDLLSSGSVQIVRALLENHLDLRAEDKRRNTPLHFLASNTNPNIVKQLQGRKVNVDARDLYNATPLLYAYTNINMIKFLLKNRADINAANRFGHTLLIKLFQTLTESNVNICKVVEILLQNGASLGAFEFNTLYYNYIRNHALGPILAIVIGHMVLCQECGQAVPKEIYQKIVAQPNLKRFIEHSRELVEKAKVRKITDSLSAYSIMVENLNQLVGRFVRCGRQMLSTLRTFHQHYKQNSKLAEIYLYRLLCERVGLITERVSLVHEASDVLNRILGWHHTDNYLIIREIVGYLTYKDMKNLIKLGN